MPDVTAVTLSDRHGVVVPWWVEGVSAGVGEFLLLRSQSVDEFDELLLGLREVHLLVHDRRVDVHEDAGEVVEQPLAVVVPGRSRVLDDLPVQLVGLREPVRAARVQPGDLLLVALDGSLLLGDDVHAGLERRHGQDQRAGGVDFAVEFAERASRSFTLLLRCREFGLCRLVGLVPSGFETVPVAVVLAIVVADDHGNDADDQRGCYDEHDFLPFLLSW